MELGGLVLNRTSEPPSKLAIERRLFVGLSPRPTRGWRLPELGAISDPLQPLGLAKLNGQEEADNDRCYLGLPYILAKVFQIWY